MDLLHTTLNGFLNFALYFGLSILLLMVFKVVYSAITPHDEWRLVREERNMAAAVGFIGAQVGFALALGSAITQSIHVLDFMLWGVIALLAQLVAYGVVRFVFLPEVSQRISQNDLSAGVILGGVSVAVGVLNAACLTY